MSNMLKIDNERLCISLDNISTVQMAGGNMVVSYYTDVEDVRWRYDIDDDRVKSIVESKYEQIIKALESKPKYIKLKKSNVIIKVENIKNVIKGNTEDYGLFIKIEYDEGTFIRVFYYRNMDDGVLYTDDDLVEFCDSDFEQLSTVLIG